MGNHAIVHITYKNSCKKKSKLRGPQRFSKGRSTIEIGINREASVLKENARNLTGLSVTMLVTQYTY